MKYLHLTCNCVASKPTLPARPTTTWKLLLQKFYCTKTIPCKTSHKNKELSNLLLSRAHICTRTNCICICFSTCEDMNLHRNYRSSLKDYLLIFYIYSTCVITMDKNYDIFAWNEKENRKHVYFKLTYNGSP